MDFAVHTYGLAAKVSESFFYKIWKRERPALKPKIGGDFMKCNACTLFADTLNGAPGVRATLDPSTIANAREMRDAHLEASVSRLLM